MTEEAALQGKLPPLLRLNVYAWALAKNLLATYDVDAMRQIIIYPSAI